ncbi:MAG TPA: carbamoyltransferase HypF [Terriglobales bacterium]|nr:carbamoyltransferase HypF [Terriglobales bacterium]
MATLSQSADTPAKRRLRVVVRGAVQGVGFRPFVYRLATGMGLSGWVINSSEGVFIEVEGDEPTLRRFLQRLQAEKPVISFIQSLESLYLDPVGFEKFEIRESSGGLKTALILPDIATCPDCLADISDPNNRRYRYPFTNCTNCGPRFTIIESLPYDRPRTSMKKFVMCAECDREYHDPLDRRFHAQPNACPACGPHLELWDASGHVLAERDDALLKASEAIGRRGLIVAVKGLGGFHLMVDARNEQAVRELRRRKRREEKPFALMYPTLHHVLNECDVSDVELRLLRSPESPIVLTRRKPECGSAADVIAPGNPYLGVMLPYTPLHHLLMRELGFPIIATSGNLSEEPICIDEHEALERLRGIADIFLMHNRPIVRHVDDSVVREMAGRELVVRRARGLAPLPVQIQDEVSTVVAVGSHQKNTIATSVGRQVFVSQHIGDLETAQSLQAFENVNAAFRGLYELKPAAIACDMHPDYASTQYAARSVEPVMAVQHHYAHVLSCMAENELQSPVLGIAWDGSGLGTDGTIWGGEFLRVHEGGFNRVAHLRTFRLPGGEKSVKEPRRTALGLLYEIYGDAAFELDVPPVDTFNTAELSVLRSMLRQSLNTPLTSSAGRLFDAVAAVAGLRQVCHFEGQAAMELEFAIRDVAGDDSYPFELRDGASIVVDWEPMVRAIVAEREAVSLIAGKFHNTLARVVVEVARRVGEPRIVLSGGCFQNRYLTEMVIRHLQEAGFQAYWHQRIPPNDGGIALGQVMAAGAELARKSKVGQ